MSASNTTDTPDTTTTEENETMTMTETIEETAAAIATEYASIVFNSADNLARALGNVLAHAGTDKVRPVLCTLCFEQVEGEDLRIVATDSFSLVVEELAEGVTAPGVLPQRLVDIEDAKAMIRLLKPAKSAPAVLSFSATEVTLEVLGSTMTAQILTHAEFPPYRKLLPSENGEAGHVDFAAIAPWQLAKFAKMRTPGAKKVSEVRPVRFEFSPEPTQPVRFTMGSTIFGVVMPVRIS